MRLSGHCPGCGGGVHHSCAIAKCSIKHDGIEYCYECDEFPCVKYKGADEYDSFITHRNQLKDIQKAITIGIKAYTQEQIEKEKILICLLENYNAGRHKTFFCIAVNLLDIQDIRKIMSQLTSNLETENMSLKDKASYAVAQFQSIADEQGIVLKLKKKPKDWK